MSKLLGMISLLAIVLVACETTDDSVPTVNPTVNDDDVELTATSTPEEPAEAAPSPDETEDDNPTPEPEPTAAADDEPADIIEAVEALIVDPGDDINSWTYEPEKLMVNAGDTIEWTNDGAAAHTVTSLEGADFEFDSDSIDSGETFKLDVPDEAGEFDYFCTFHPWMEATVIVEE